MIEQSEAKKRIFEYNIFPANNNHKIRHYNIKPIEDLFVLYESKNKKYFHQIQLTT